MVGRRTQVERDVLRSVILLVATPLTLLAQRAPPAFAPGTVTDSVVAGQDSSQVYATYVPASYVAQKPAPILYVLDPRGRALLALELFREPAERLGWILASSYNTRSDVPQDLNTPALAAMLADTQVHLSIDVRRLYLAGFSGTARSAWALAGAVSTGVTGIISAGAGPPVRLSVEMIPRLATLGFAFFGTAGRMGFNYEEVYELETMLVDTDFEHRVMYFEGGHRWMPPALSSRAMEWMEILAMKKGLRPADEALTRTFYEAELARADSLVVQERPLEAYRTYKGIADTYDGLTDVTVATARRDELAGSRGMRDALDRRHREANEYFDYVNQITVELRGLLTGDGPPESDKLLRGLRIHSLLERARGQDRDEAAQARRLLAQVDVMLSFYQPREALASGRSDIALAELLVADVIQSGRPGVCLLKARALAHLARLDEAVTALRCAAAGGLVDPASIEADRDFDALRGNPAFQALVESLRRS